MRKWGSKWAVVDDIGHDPAGKSKQKWHSGFGTRREAEVALDGVLQSLATGACVEPSKLTVGAYLERWLAAGAKPRVAGTTYDRYADLVRGHLIPALGAPPLAKLAPLHVQTFYWEARASGGRRKGGPRGLSPMTP